VGQARGCGNELPLAIPATREIASGRSPPQSRSRTKRNGIRGYAALSRISLRVIRASKPGLRDHGCQTGLKYITDSGGSVSERE